MQNTLNQYPIVSEFQSYDGYSIILRYTFKAAMPTPMVFQVYEFSTRFALSHPRFAGSHPEYQHFESWIQYIGTVIHDSPSRWIVTLQERAQTPPQVKIGKLVSYNVITVDWIVSMPLFWYSVQRAQFALLYRELSSCMASFWHAHPDIDPGIGNWFRQDFIPACWANCVA